MKFYLGTHMPSWLSRTTVPLFVSHRRLCSIKKLPRAICSWSLDSGGFSELEMYGEWRSSTKDYVAAVYRYRDEIGNMQWAAIRDWMCEPFMVKKTGLSVREHQRRTIDSYVELMTLAPDLPWVPVLQGYTLDEYRQHLDDFDEREIDLRKLPLVGVGSVCRRQHTDEITQIFQMFSLHKLKMHGFGVKIKGLINFRHLLTSADSMAWSKQARHEHPLDGHTGHINCANCRIYAELWYRLQVWPLIHGLPQTSFTIPRVAKRRLTPKIVEETESCLDGLFTNEQTTSAKTQGHVEVLNVVA